MPYYITYGEFQRHMKEYYLRTGNRMQFPEMSDYLFRKGLLKETPPETPASKEMFGNMTDEEIAALAEKYGHKIDGSPVEKGECAADTQEAVLEANE